MLESEIKKLIVAINELNDTIRNTAIKTNESSSSVPEVSTAPDPVEPPPAPPASAVPMPGLPSLEGLDGLPTSDKKAPFSSPTDMVKYVSACYQAHGATHGTQMQQIIASLGVTNINELTPEKYDELYNKFEDLIAEATAQ